MKLKKFYTREATFFFALVVHGMWVYLLLTLPDSLKVEVFSTIAFLSMSCFAGAFGLKIYQLKMEKDHENGTSKIEVVEHTKVTEVTENKEVG